MMQSRLDNFYFFFYIIDKESLLRPSPVFGIGTHGLRRLFLFPYNQYFNPRSHDENYSLLLTGSTSKTEYSMIRIVVLKN